MGFPLFFWWGFLSLDFCFAYSGWGGDGFGELDVCFAYSGDVSTMTIVGGVLPDGTQRIGRGEVGAQTPLRLPSLPSETSHPPHSSRLCDCWVR